MKLKNDYIWHPCTQMKDHEDFPLVMADRAEGVYIYDEEGKAYMDIISSCLLYTSTWYWKQYAHSGLFDLDKPIREYSSEEYNLLLYGSRDGKGEPENPKVTGLFHKYTKTLLNRDISNKSKHTQEKSRHLIAEVECTDCHGMKMCIRDSICSVKRAYLIGWKRAKWKLSIRWGPGTLW